MRQNNRYVIFMNVHMIPFNQANYFFQKKIVVSLLGKEH